MIVAGSNNIMQLLLFSLTGESLMPAITPLVNSLTVRLENLSRQTFQNVKIYSEVLHGIRTAELLISRARSLKLKFACDSANRDNKDIDKFVLDLMSQDEVKVIGAARGPVGTALMDMFAESKVSSQIVWSLIFFEPFPA